MTRKERQAANGIGSQKIAEGADRANREQRFKPLKKKEDVKPISITEKLGIDNSKGKKSKKG